MKHLLQQIFLILLFALSIWLRYPNKKLLNNLCTHESITAHTLTTLLIWNQKGIENCHFAPIYTFNFPLDKETYVFSRVTDHWTNDKYYVSYPPLNFYLAYVLFKISKQEISVIGLRILGLAVQFICGALIFYLILFLGSEPLDSLDYIPAYFGFVFYIFSAGNLWINGYLFFSDTIVQPFFIAFVFAVLALLRKKDTKRVDLGLLFTMSFLMVFTEWIGILASFTALFIIFLNKRTINRWEWASTAIITGVITSLVTTFLIYSAIDGPKSYIRTAFEKFLFRTGISAYSEEHLGYLNSESYKLLKMYNESGFGVALKITFGILLLFIINRKKWKLNVDKLSKHALFLAALPCILHILILFNFNVRHSFSVHKNGLFYSLLPSVFLICMHNKQNKFRPLYTIMSICILTVYIHFSYLKFIKENKAHMIVTPFKEIGEKIRQYAYDCSAVFIDTNSHCELFYYSKRNPMFRPSLMEARKKYNDYNFEGYGLFAKTKNGKLAYLIKFNRNEDSLLVWRNLKIVTK